MTEAQAKAISTGGRAVRGCMDAIVEYKRAIANGRSGETERAEAHDYLDAVLDQVAVIHG